MCRRVQCSTCGKPTFAGCGLHVEQVLADVPQEQRCQGHAREKREAKGGQGEPKAARSRWWWPF